MEKDKKEKVINFENKKENDKNKKYKLSDKSKRVIIISSVSIFVIIVAILIIVYLSNETAREFMDKYLFGKNITEENAEVIEIENENGTSIVGNSKTVGLLTNNTLKQYNSGGRLESELNIEVNNPMYDYNNRYLIVGQKNGNKVYLIRDSRIVWKKEIEGSILTVSVNKNGYSSIILTGAYRTFIVILNPEGNEMFRTYCANTIAVDSCISNDNKYLAFAEISTSSTSTKSNIKILSIDKAMGEESEPITYTYEVPDNALAIEINYLDNGKLVCMFDSSIQVIENNSPRVIMDLTESNSISFAGIGLENSIFRAIEESSGLFSADTKIEIINVNNERKNVYTVKGVAKEVKTYNNVIALNLGTEIEFIDTNGWLIKRYNSSSEVKDIILGDGLAGIVYKDKVEIINL